MFSVFLFLVSLLTAAFIVKADWRDKEIPLCLLGGFAVFSILHFWEYFSFPFLILTSLLGVILLHLEKRKFIGLADCLLIPSCLLWIKPEKIPLFFIISGALGLLTALYWQRTHRDNAYPFAPSILGAWILSF